MQKSKKHRHHTSTADEDHAQHALEHIAEEKLEAMQKEETEEDHTHSDVQLIIHRMEDSPSEGQFYGLSKEALKIHQHGWDSLEKLEKKINDLKKF